MGEGFLSTYFMPGLYFPVDIVRFILWHAEVFGILLYSFKQSVPLNILIWFWGAVTLLGNILI